MPSKLPTAVDLGIVDAKPALGVAQIEGATGLEGRGAAALGDAGQSVGAAAEYMWREKERTDTAKVEDAWNQYKNAALDVTSGNGGVLKTQGGDAVNGGILQKATEGLKSARDRIEETLDTDQKRLFAPRFQQTDLQVKQQVLGHIDQQNKVYSKTVMDGTQATAKAMISSDPTNPKAFTNQFDTVMAQADIYLRQAGITDKGFSELYKNKLSDELWETRYDKLIYSQPGLADSIFRANSGEIKDDKLRLRLQSQINEAATGIKATQDSVKLIQEVRNDNPVVKATIEPGTAGAELTRINAAIAKWPKNKQDSADYQDLVDAKAALEGGMTKVSDSGKEEYAPSTNGLPNSRDVAAQLPLALAKIETYADASYGKDKFNPDRAQYVAKLTQQVKTKISEDVSQLNSIQRQSQGQIIDFVTGVTPQAGAGGMTQVGSGRAGTPGMLVTSFSQIQANPEMMRAWQRMDPQAKLGIERLMEHNLRAGSKEEGDPILYRNIYDRINLPEGDPNKIVFSSQIIDPKIADRLSIPQIQHLEQTLKQWETPGGRSFNQLRTMSEKYVTGQMLTNTAFTAQPDKANAATMAWTQAAGKKIDEYAAAGKDPRPLFTLQSKESLISPEYLRTFVNTTPAEGLANKAKDVVEKTQGFTPNQIKQFSQLPPTATTPDAVKAYIQTLPMSVKVIRDHEGRPFNIPDAMRIKSTREAPKSSGKVTLDEINASRAAQ